MADHTHYAIAPANDDAGEPETLHSFATTEEADAFCAEREGQRLLTDEVPAWRLRDYQRRAEEGEFGWTDDETHYQGLDGGPDTPMVNGFLRIEDSTRDDRFWMSLFPTAQDAAEDAVNQECAGDWEIRTIVDLRTGQELEIASTTFTFKPKEA